MAVAQQTRPLAHRMLIGGDARGMRWVEAEHEPVEKTPPRRRAFDKQPVHLGGQPRDADDLAERGLAARCLAVDPDDPPLAARGIAASTDLDRAASRLDCRGDGPTGALGFLGVLTALDVAEPGMAQSAPRRQ